MLLEDWRDFDHVPAHTCLQDMYNLGSCKNGHRCKHRFGSASVVFPGYGDNAPELPHMGSGDNQDGPGSSENGGVKRVARSPRLLHSPSDDNGIGTAAVFRNDMFGFAFQLHPGDFKPRWLGLGIPIIDNRLHLPGPDTFR